jgi:uncharacterized protein YcaQ
VTRAVPPLAELRRFALRRSLFTPTTLERAIAKLGFVQADPIRAPARAQDLILRERVRDYRAGDLEERYAELAVEEDFFVNYGFVAPALSALMHPRSGFERHSRARAKKADEVLAFVHASGAAHPRDVERHLGGGTEKNYWGGTSNLTTRLLDALHYRGQLRVARREGGIRVYAPAPERLLENAVDASVDALIDVAVNKYAPLPAQSLATLVSRLRYAAPQWRGELRRGLARAKERLSRAQVDGVDWFWPAGEDVRRVVKGQARELEGRVRLLSPFDPVVWDRRRFELFWGWAYRFEAYTPVKQRKLGYYALPLFWGEHAIGWANLTHDARGLVSTLGYVAGKPPRERAFRHALEDELARFERFLRPRPPRRARAEHRA